MLKWLIRIPLFLILIAGLMYLGACIYANVSAMDTNPAKIPNVDKAEYKVKVTNTGSVYYSNNVDDSGGVVIMHGYWQTDGDKYKYCKADSPPLDRDNWGPITVKVRNG